MIKNKINVSVVQASPVMFNLKKTIEKVRSITKNAKSQGAELILFPETFISGYPKGCDFSVKLGYRKPEGRETYKEYYDSSIAVGSEEISTLSEIAAENQIYLVIGVVEKEHGTLYCSVFFFDRTGKYLGKHRKLMPTAMERVVWGQGDGSTLPVFDTEVGKIGAVICWENYMPLLRFHMYSKDIQIYCAPTVDDRDEWISTIKHIALEGRCYVLSACQYLTKEDYPEGASLNPDPNILIRGGSCIISPLGQILTGPVYNEEAILTAELDLDLIVKAKYDLDVVGHYSRPDVFSLFVNENPIKKM